jgi:U3 small nucleolar RNA-associated protein 23
MHCMHTQMHAPRLTPFQAYKKLLHQYELNFGFREPYQVLLDSAILQDAYQFKIDIVGRLEKVLGAKVKPMITTCDMRHLYLAKPKNETLILQAKEYERRRCGHHELDEPLSSLECLASVVDPKDSNTNKHRYVVAANDISVRARMRKVAGVPLIYISKSVVLMEPMTSATEDFREREEKSKFKMGLKGQRKPDAGEKRKRDEGEDNISVGDQATGDHQKKRRQKGPKGPNPLSVKKSKKDAAAPSTSAKPSKPAATESQPAAAAATEGEASEPRKRKRKHKSKTEGGVSLDQGETQGETEAS